MNALLSLPSVVRWKSQLESFNDDQLSAIYTLVFNKNFKLNYQQNMKFVS